MRRTFEADAMTAGPVVDEAAGIDEVDGRTKGHGGEWTPVYAEMNAATFNAPSLVSADRPLDAAKLVQRS
jgi:hypothetical protein